MTTYRIEIAILLNLACSGILLGASIPAARTTQPTTTTTITTTKTAEPTKQNEQISSQYVMDLKISGHTQQYFQIQGSDAGGDTIPEQMRPLLKMYPGADFTITIRRTSRICINMGDDGCVNGEVAGSGSDKDYLTGGFNPGK